MAMPGSPMVRRRRLAAELRSIRESSGKSGDNVAAALNWSPSKISRYELARTGLKVPEVEKLLDYYQISGARRDQLLDLARDAAKKAWWEDYPVELSLDYRQYIGFEHEASSIAIWHVEVVPGLLQTQAYARDIIANYGVIEPIAPGMIERLVRLRMQRQQVLTREPPVELSVVLDESCLQRRIGTEQVMYDQLTHLAELASRPNIAIRILPLEARHTVLGPAFVVFHFGSFSDAILHDVVASEQLKNVYTVEDEQQTHLHGLVFQSLVSASLDEDSSRALILQTAESCWSNGRADGATI
jgi:transcriptional regulator with XRE-family HTH domain